MIDRLLAATWHASPTSPRLAETARSIDNVVLYRLMLLAQNPQASEQARAIAYLKLDELRKWMTARQAGDAEERAHLVFAASQIKRFEDDPKQIGVSKPAAPPDGPPI
ncbi:MAG TPA: hypothetical protein VG273_17465 [Bryobacteraceae bacterium]|nr:hypothetical protein [Bryobacteraceae bacterium]